jgi:1-acyl-sn-glycerol-3-phosphate acyltransferase
MRKIINILASSWFWFELFFISALLFPTGMVIWLATVLFDRRLFLLNRFSCIWSTVVFFLNPLWKVTISGKEKIDKGMAYVIVSNHQSGVDILVLFKLMIHFKWVAKRSLYWFPFIGWNMAMNRYIALKRGRKSSINKMVEQCKRALQDGNSIMIFPEGTRSRDGSVQPFKTGAFRIALETKVPILPIALCGTSRAIKKGGLMIHRSYDMKVEILDPVAYGSFAEQDQKKVAASVQQIISERVSSHTENPSPQELSRPAL